MILVLLVIFRIIAPPLILNKLNKELNEFSPTISAHVEDLDLQLIKGGAVLKNISAKVKINNKKFLKVASAHGAFELRELFKGKIVSYAVVENLDLTYSEDLLRALREHLKQTEMEQKPLPAIRVSRIDLKKSIIRLDNFGVILDEINARATNLIPNKNLPKTIFSVQGKLLKSGILKANGEAMIEENPLMWTVDSELLKFDLTTLNQFLLKKVPLTFTKGQMDFYMEAKSENKKITGYLKPFIKDLKVIRKNENFKGTKHWLVELITALSYMAAKSDDVVATRVPFVFDGQVKAETGEALSKTFQHGYVQELSRGIENSIRLK